ncbi:ATP-binding protein [Sphingomonas prati]|uniref:histidine kinase n=1 Tax=Sphingomonas prati TaxID=1843237 RepID=A0A7W9F067_9SPHN|nr:sensor histidine kinase [Sphingomonas prati]MBB5728011.1 two-component sensor histidine kinase [Sphingomonas prati]
MTHLKSDTRPTRTEERLLGLFSAVPDRVPSAPDGTSRTDRALWAADALHRANNLTQMSSSLASLGTGKRFGPVADDHVGRARALSRAYAELGTVDGSGLRVPCAPLLVAIVERLVALFGEARSIHVRLLVEPVALPHDQRRALTLIASELVINALKYAFPNAASGTIDVSLRQRGPDILLSVADDGCGMPADHAQSRGQGTGLMARLCALLNAAMQCDTGPGGSTIVISVPQIAGAQ